MGNCKFRIEKGGCKLSVCPDNEICNIRVAEPNCPDYVEQEDYPMTPDEVVKKLKERLKIRKQQNSDYGTTPQWQEDVETFSSAISLIQDYQKLREGKVFSFQVSKEGELLNEEDVLWLSFKDGMINLNALADSKPGIVGKRLREAIVTYLQQPTEH